MVIRIFKQYGWLLCIVLMCPVAILAGLGIISVFVASIENVDETGEGTEYMWRAIKQRNYDDVSAFITEGSADVNNRTTDGTSPLIHAVQANDARMVTLLISLGANVRCRTNAGKAAWDIATETGRKHLMRLLTKRYTRSRT